MTIREKLIKLHTEEDALNKQMGKIEHSIKLYKKDKAKLAKRISANMKYRNRLINQLPTP